MSQNAQTTAANVLPAVPQRAPAVPPPGFEVGRSRKHPYLDRRDVGRITLSGTAGDVRTMHNTRSLIRRRMREAQLRRTRVMDIVDRLIAPRPGQGRKYGQLEAEAALTIQKLRARVAELEARVKELEERHEPQRARNQF
jgi:hypothetical protein